MELMLETVSTIPDILSGKYENALRQWPSYPSVYTFSLFGSLVVNADILSSNEEKSAPHSIQPSGATNPVLTSFAYLDPELGRFCKFTLELLRNYYKIYRWGYLP